MHPEDTCKLLAPNSQTYDPKSDWKIQTETMTTMPNHVKKHKDSEKNKINKENPRFVNGLKYSLTPEYNKFNAKGKNTIQNKTLHTVHEVPVSQVPIISDFSLQNSKSVWRKRTVTTRNNSSILYNKALCTYIEAPYEAITDLLDEGNADYEISNAAQLFQQDLELKDLQLRVEQIKIENKTTGASSKDY